MLFISVKKSVYKRLQFSIIYFENVLKSFFYSTIGKLLMSFL